MIGWNKLKTKKVCVILSYTHTHTPHTRTHTYTQTHIHNAHTQTRTFPIETHLLNSLVELVFRTVLYWDDVFLIVWQSPIDCNSAEKFVEKINPTGHFMKYELTVMESGGRITATYVYCQGQNAESKMMKILKKEDFKNCRVLNKPKRWTLLSQNVTLDKFNFSTSTEFLGRL